MDIYSFDDPVDFRGRQVATSVILETSFSKEIRISMLQDHLIKEHKTPFPIIVHLLEGEIEFRVGEQEAYRLRAGDIITLPGGVPHSLLAFQNSTVRLTLSKQDRTERVEEVVKTS